MPTQLSQVSWNPEPNVLLFETIGLAPRIMGIGPTFAIPKVLAKVGLTKEDVDLFEVRLIKKKTGFNVTVACID
jgi:acetyl-CoA acetyltransferase